MLNTASNQRNQHVTGKVWRVGHDVPRAAVAAQSVVFAGSLIVVDRHDVGRVVVTKRL